jgi:hypothetical protein
MQRRAAHAPETRTRWQPTPHEQYFLILANGSIQQFPWNGTAFDRSAWQFGNCFRRRTVAEHARQAIQEVLQHLQQHQG